MKISNKAAYDYETNRVSEENGWIKWYNKEKNGKKLRLTGIYALCFMIAAIRIVSKNFTSEIKTLGIPEIIGLLVVNVIILLFVIAPIREILHLLPVSKGKLNSNCIISFRNYFSIYNGNVNRSQILLSLALPIVVFVSFLATAAIFTSGIARCLAIFLLVEACCMCYADIYMFFFCIKNIGKNEKIYGEYKTA